jgi:hypothetical protein
MDDQKKQGNWFAVYMTVLGLSGTAFFSYWWICLAWGRETLITTVRFARIHKFGGMAPLAAVACAFLSALGIAAIIRRKE